jgi:hypothetical protein
MSITETKNAFVDPTPAAIGLAQMFSVTAASSDPAWLVLTVLDRNEYTAGASGATGSLSGNGHTLNLSSLGGDGRGAGIVFTYQPSTGRYYSSIYGYLDQLIYNGSGSASDVTNLSLFGTSNLSIATAGASSAYAMMQADPSGYLGSATVVTQAKFTGPVPAQATPDSIASIADGFVGQAWNEDGCWVLASTVAADAGASLPVQSTEIGLPGQPNGEWIVAFNGPAGQSANWQSMVTAGEIVVIGTPGGGGHITTCVSGSGPTAMLVDNATFVTNGGQVTNLAKDGSGSDIIIAAPHLASREWAGVQAASVVIYELDTPIVADTVSSLSLSFHVSQTLGGLFTATDPANKTITQWQVYDTATSDTLVFGGSGDSDHAAATALTVMSLSAVALLAGAVATTDMLDVRAYNGSYWGDWVTLNVAVTPPAPSPPVLTAQTPSQTWTDGKPIALPVAFSDPQGETLSYSAKLSNGQALPAWLAFNATTDTFSGIAPAAAQTLNIVVTATDTSALSASESFSATVVGAPAITARTANQTWTEGKAISLALPANTFTDPQGQTLVYTASLGNGQALPDWLSFNAATETFTGTAPAVARNLSLEVTATDNSGLATSESFAATVQPAPPLKPSVLLAIPTANQTWIDGTSVTLALPAATFTDALGLKMTFAAYETGGLMTSWLRFNPATDTFSGSVPENASGTIGLAVIATDARNMIAVDMFSVTFAPAATNVTAGASPGALSLAPLQSLSGLIVSHA